MPSSVPTTVRCSGVEPATVRETAVEPGRPAATSDLASWPTSCAITPITTRVSVVANAVQSGSACGDVDRGERVVGGVGQRHAGVAGNAGHRADPGYQLEAELGLAERDGERGAAAADERVALEQPDHAAAGPDVADHRLGQLGVGDRRVGGVDEDDALAAAAQHVAEAVDRGEDHVGPAEHGGGPQRQQVGVAGAGADERDRARVLLGLLGSCHVALPIRSAAPASSRSAARRRPTASASSNGPVADNRRSVCPSTSTTTPRR